MRGRYLAALSCLMGSVLTASAATPRHILLIAIDDLKPVTGVYGASIQTPHMDRLAGEGTLFERAYCQQAVCAPSRASVLTGLYPDELRVWDLKTKIRDERPEVVTLPQWLIAQGYRTAGVGKVFDPRSVDRGMDTVSWSVPFAKSWALPYYNEDTGSPAAGHYHDPRIHALDAEAIEASGGDWLKRVQYLRERDAFPAWERMDVPDDAYEASAIATQTIRWIEAFAGDEQPFFIAAGFKKPHLPFVAPERYWALYDDTPTEAPAFTEQAAGSPGFAYHDSHELRTYSGIPAEGPIPDATAATLRQGYYATVSYVDAQIGRILDALDAAGLADDTLVVLFGDHGFHLGDHGLWCKHTNFEQATRVPFLIREPGAEPRVIEAPVELVDLFPTIADWVGRKAPEALPGRSLLGGEALVDDRATALSQYPRPGLMGYSLRSRNYRYTAWLPWDEDAGRVTNGEPVAEEFYDYRNDPEERVNRIEVEALADAVESHRQALRARVPALSQAPKICAQE